MRAGNLSDRITFQVATFTVANGQTLKTWGGDFDDMAEVQRQTTTSTRFLIRYRLDLTPEQIVNMPKTHRILFEGKVFDITDALPDRKRSEIALNCDFAMMLEVTHLQSTEREFVEGLPLVRTDD